MIQTLKETWNLKQSTYTYLYSLNYHKKEKSIVDINIWFYILNLNETQFSDKQIPRIIGHMDTGHWLDTPKTVMEFALLLSFIEKLQDSRGVDSETAEDTIFNLRDCFLDQDIPRGVQGSGSRGDREFDSINSDCISDLRKWF